MIVDERLEFVARGGEWWLPGLAARLVADFWANHASFGDSSRYTTGGWLGRPQSSGTTARLATLHCGTHNLMVEEPSTQVALHLSANGLSLDSVAQTADALTSLASGLKRVAAVPTLAGTVGELVRCIHVLARPEPGYDTSHSTPCLPFSIFLSAPAGEPDEDWRVAESIVHEAMHLQLTLIERAVPLVVAGGEGEAYSPWQGRLRPAQGLLHGLYVFRVIDAMFEAVEARHGQIPFLRKRRREIAAEIAQVEDLAVSPALTAEGRAFARHLLASGH